MGPDRKEVGQVNFGHSGRHHIASGRRQTIIYHFQDQEIQLPAVGRGGSSFKGFQILKLEAQMKMCKKALPAGGSVGLGHVLSLAKAENSRYMQTCSASGLVT